MCLKVVAAPHPNENQSHDVVSMKKPTGLGDTWRLFLAVYAVASHPTAWRRDDSVSEVVLAMYDENDNCSTVQRR